MASARSSPVDPLDADGSTSSGPRRTDAKGATTGPVPSERHVRQLVLPEVGPQGQRRLAAASVLVVGCGGLGAPVVHGLAAGGVGRLVLVDDDVVESSNLNRQVLFTVADVGRRKAVIAAARALALAPDATVEARVERIVPGAVRKAVQGFDLVVDATDGLPTKYMLNDACVREDVPLVHGAATAWSGQVLVVPGRRGPCLRCLFEDLPPAGAMPTCRDAGILGAVTGVVGSFMSAEAIKVLLGHTSQALIGRFLAIDVLAPSVRAVTFERRAACAACGDAPTADALRAADYVLADDSDGSSDEAP